MDMQKFLDAMSANDQRTRANYHLTLGELIAALEKIPNRGNVTIALDTGGGVRGMDSYRGYYSDLALTPCGDMASAAALLDDAKAANGNTFDGYKGGEYRMGEDTPLWVSEWGETSDVAVMGLLYVEGATTATLQTKVME